MLQRIEESKGMVAEKQAYAKFKILVPTLSHEQAISGVLKFYDLSDADRALRPTNAFLKETTFDDLQATLLRLAGEAINRDTISYIQTGQRGAMASEMYKVCRN